MKRGWCRIRLLACLGIMLAAPPGMAAYDGIWVHVDTNQSVTEVRRGDQSLLVLDHVAFGRGGFEEVRLRGSHQTPLGEFRINRINRQSRFHIFLGIDYPRRTHLDEALARGLIDQSQHREAVAYVERNGYVSQVGPLGGHLGFHGIGAGDPDIHDRFHWTQGCIAMTNEQVEAFYEFVDVGTPVVIE